jgi:hypothetical protein
MKNNLTADELAELIRSVFGPSETDTVIALVTDIPNDARPDNDQWRERRRIVSEWYGALKVLLPRLGLDSVGLYAYENVVSNNADLPGTFFRLSSLDDTITAKDLPFLGIPVGRDTILDNTDILLVPTEYSATAPLKILGKRFSFRAATMPGFSRSMIPALGLDYGEVHKRVMMLKNRLDAADHAAIVYAADGADFDVFVDLRYRTAHASSGLIREAGTAGNLPSGESYIVPYEGERTGEPSRTSGTLPIRFNGELLIYHIENNRVNLIEGGGDKAVERRAFLAAEPAYGNIAELGFGILGGFGVEAVGSVLLDEKLGLHIALGRSEHFGGIVGPSSFNDPSKVVHIDHVYVPSLQPGITVRSVRLGYPTGGDEIIMKDNNYII